MSVMIATLAPSVPRFDNRFALGISVGLLAATIGALYTVVARWGINHGLQSTDLTFLRFAVAGLVTLPVLALAWRRDQPGMIARWRAWLAIGVLAGPLFGLLMFTAFQFAPASHAAVFPFSAMSVMGTVLAAIVLGDRITARKTLGIATVLSGLIVLSGVDAASLTGHALIGDALFVCAGTMWAGFGLVLRRHKLDPLLATAVVSFFALFTYVPIYLMGDGIYRLLDAAPAVVWVEVLVQGLIAGAGTLYTYAKMVSLLGVSRAAVFPALAPGIAALLAWPVLGHIPDTYESLGLVIAVVGLLVTVTSGKPATSNSVASR
ncbi:MAG: DMT family transporter [Hyphomicrobium sp.]|nr:DMT family transporter [Hyphomicrobium sp.]